MIAAAKLEGARLDDLIAGLDVLRQWGSKPEVQQRYKQTAAERWPGADAFKA